MCKIVHILAKLLEDKPNPHWLKLKFLKRLSSKKRRGKNLAIVPLKRELKFKIIRNKLTKDIRMAKMS